tara:strand:+ start:90 stop:422 length:333 start_codon:yes stop_codon:yes gene_type:complete
MKQFILVFILFLTFSSAAFNNFFKDSENPNGDPFVLSLGIEKNIHSFKYYNQSTFYATLPISKLLTVRYREHVQYQEDMEIFKSKHDMIQDLDKHYALELHIPIYKIWNK